MGDTIWFVCKQKQLKCILWKKYHISCSYTEDVRHISVIKSPYYSKRFLLDKTKRKTIILTHTDLVKSSSLRNTANLLHHSDVYHHISADDISRSIRAMLMPQLRPLLKKQFRSILET